MLVILVSSKVCFEFGNVIIKFIIKELFSNESNWRIILLYVLIVFKMYCWCYKNIEFFYIEINIIS